MSSGGEGQDDELRVVNSRFYTFLEQPSGQPRLPDDRPQRPDRQLPVVRCRDGGGCAWSPLLHDHMTAPTPDLCKSVLCKEFTNLATR